MRCTESPRRVSPSVHVPIRPRPLTIQSIQTTDNPLDLMRQATVATSVDILDLSKKCLNHFITSHLYSKMPNFACKSEGRDSPVYCRNWIHRHLQHTADHHRPTSIYRLHSIHICLAYVLHCHGDVGELFFLSSHLQGRLDTVARHGPSIAGLGTKGVLAPTGPLTIHRARLFIATLLLKGLNHEKVLTVHMFSVSKGPSLNHICHVKMKFAQRR